MERRGINLLTAHLNTFLKSLHSTLFSNEEKTSRIEPKTVSGALVASSTPPFSQNIAANRAFEVLTGTSFKEEAPLMETMIYDLFEEIEFIHQNDIEDLSFDYIDSLLEEIRYRAPQNLHSILKQALQIGEKSGPHACELRAHLEQWLQDLKPSPFKSSKMLKLPMEENPVPTHWKTKLIRLGFAALVISILGVTLAPVGCRLFSPSQVDSPAPTAPTVQEINDSLARLYPEPARIEEPTATVQFCKGSHCKEILAPLRLLDKIAPKGPATDLLESLKSSASTRFALAQGAESMPLIGAPENEPENATLPESSGLTIFEPSEVIQEWNPLSVPFNPQKTEEIISKLPVDQAAQVYHAMKTLKEELDQGTFQLLKNCEKLEEEIKLANEITERNSQKVNLDSLKLNEMYRQFDIHHAQGKKDSETKWHHTFVGEENLKEWGKYKSKTDSWSLSRPLLLYHFTAIAAGIPAQNAFAVLGLNYGDFPNVTPMRLWKIYGFGSIWLRTAAALSAIIFSSQFPLSAEPTETVKNIAFYSGLIAGMVLEKTWGFSSKIPLPSKLNKSLSIANERLLHLAFGYGIYKLSAFALPYIFNHALPFLSEWGDSASSYVYSHTVPFLTARMDQFQFEPWIPSFLYDSLIGAAAGIPARHTIAFLKTLHFDFLKWVAVKRTSAKRRWVFINTLGSLKIYDIYEKWLPTTLKVSAVIAAAQFIIASNFSSAPTDTEKKIALVTGLLAGMIFESKWKTSYRFPWPKKAVLFAVKNFSSTVSHLFHLPVALGIYKLSEYALQNIFSKK